VTKPWDKKMKRLFREAPEDFVEWLFPGAKFMGIVSNELDGEPIYTDMLCEIMLNEERVLLHIEFQRRRDSRMAVRMWEYNVRATLQYQCPVWSVVIYLKPDSTVAEPVLARKLPDGRVIHRFEFEVIRLWEIATQELKQKGLVGLLPLLPLTREGARREIIEEAIIGLMPPGEEGKAELLTLTYGLASLALENEADQEWLSRRFEMLQDILRETKAYREMTKESRQEGREEGIREGREEGIREGKLEGLREALLTLVQARFSNPMVTRLAKGQAAIIDDPAILQDLILKVGLAQTLEEVQRDLLEWPGVEDDQDQYPS